MNQYINEIKSINLLDETETNTLINSFRNGNVEAKNELIVHNLRMVLYIACQYEKSVKEPVEDLIWIGVEGLIRAINSYIPNEKCKFSSHAFRCITNHFNNYYDRLNCSKRKENNVSIQNIIIQSDINVDMQILNVLKNNEESVEDQVIKKIEKEQLLSSLNLLNPKDKLILLLRYGLYDGRCYKLPEIAKLFKVTGERVRQKEVKALRKLKKIYDEYSK